MDPLSTLGVVANIMAVIDFTWTVITEARTIYNSKSGATEGALVLDILIEDIGCLNDSVSAEFSSDAEVKRMVEKSKEITKDLRDGLKSLKNKEKRSKWKSLTAALAEVWGKDKTRTLWEQLRNLQDQLARHMHDDLRDQISRMSRAIKNLEATSDTLEVTRRKDLQAFKEDIIKAAKEFMISNNHNQNSMHGAPALEEDVLVDYSRTKAALQDFRYFEKATMMLKDAVSDMETNHRFLRSLQFSAIRVRRREIQKAHSRTFEWIYEDSIQFRNASRKLTFKEWLESKSAIFWIYGKPGSGKSTLMKLLMQHESTLKYLNLWAGPKKLVIASYFFWNAGTLLQRSQEGLVRSLLFDIIRQCPELIPDVKKLGFSASDGRWDLDDLLEIYGMIMEKNLATKFCFFIDGLDEYKEDHRSHLDLVRTLRDLQFSDNVKICVSSRPWVVFGDELMGNGYFTIKLEDLTRDDIMRYVTDRLQEHSQFDKLVTMNKAYKSLVESVVDRAQGVFLWVHLVVRTLLEGLTYHDSVKTLQRRLDAFPPDLESFFLHLISSVPEFYHIQMARSFKAATTADEPLSVMLYSFLDDLEAYPDYALEMPARSMHTWEVEARHHNMRRRLDACSKGLLEFVDWNDYGLAATNPAEDPFFSLRVDFFHRTVRDFLHDSDETQILLQKALKEENLPLVACHATLAEIKMAPFTRRDEGRMKLLIEQLFAFASEAIIAPSSHIVLHEILDNAEETYKSICEEQAWIYTKRFFLGMSATIGFIPFLHAGLTAQPAMLHPSEESSLTIRPLLDYALNPQQSKYRMSIEGVRFLLKEGANPNERFQDSTVWTDFLSSGLRYVDLDKEAKLELVRLLLEHGASPTALVKSESQKGRRQSIQNQQTISQRVASDVLAMTFGQAVIDQMLLDVEQKRHPESGRRQRTDPNHQEKTQISLSPEISPHPQSQGIDLGLHQTSQISPSHRSPERMIQPASPVFTRLEPDLNMQSTLKKQRPWYISIFRVVACKAR